MILSLMPEPKVQFFGNNGLPLAGGLLYTYKAGSFGVPKTTYADATGTANTNPVILDSAGRASVWLDGYYAVKLTDSTGVTIWTQDNISVLGSSDSATVLVDASNGTQTVVIPENQQDTTYIKIDDSANTVSLTPVTGSSFLDNVNPIIYNQYESITVRFNNGKYYVIKDDNIVPFSTTISYSTAEPTAAQIIELNAELSNVSVALNEFNSQYTIVRTDLGSSYTATIIAPTGYTIQNESSYTLSVGGESVDLLLSGTNYYRI